jgi:hypothetical protein
MSYFFSERIVGSPLLAMTAEYVFFDKFVEITSGCSGLDPCVRSVFAAGNLSHGFHQRNGRFLSVV